jgi:hypothetical protein
MLACTLTKPAGAYIAALNFILSLPYCGFTLLRLVILQFESSWTDAQAGQLQLNWSSHSSDCVCAKTISLSGST